MDILCPNCGEPWDMDTLHEVTEQRYAVPYYKPERDSLRLGLRRQLNPAYDKAAYSKAYDEVRREFQLRGCIVLGGGQCEKVQSMATAAASAVYELLGDDLDGAASLLEDWL